MESLGCFFSFLLGFLAIRELMSLPHTLLPLSSDTPFRGLKPWEPPKSVSLYNPSLYKSITSGDSFQRWGANRGANQSPPQSHRPILAFLSSLGVMFSLGFIHSWVKPRLSALTVPSNNLRRFLV